MSALYLDSRPSSGRRPLKLTFKKARGQYEYVCSQPGWTVKIDERVGFVPDADGLVRSLKYGWFATIVVETHGNTESGPYKSLAVAKEAAPGLLLSELQGYERSLAISIGEKKKRAAALREEIARLEQ